MKPKPKKVWSNFAWGVLLVLLVDLLLQVFGRRFGWGVANSGISFGAFKEISEWVLIFAWVVVAIWYYKRIKNSKTRIKSGLIFVLVGGVGNLLARLLMGQVWDYIYLPFLPFWFNLSDVLISTGVLSYILGDNED